MVTETYQNVAITEEAAGCLLCAGSPGPDGLATPAPCAKACSYSVPADAVIRALRFENSQGASNKLPGVVPCATCQTKSCLSACLKGKINRPVALDELMLAAAALPKASPKPVDLSIGFCGVECENPFFLSSSVVGSNYEMVAKAFRMGWAGVAFKTVATFSANEVSPRFDALRKESVPFVGFKNIEQISEYSLTENLSYLRRLKKDFPTKIIVASIMGQDEAEWTQLAELMTAVGADIIECNFSCPHMAANGLGSDVGQNPELVAAYTRATRRGTSLPILAKMTPNIGNMELPAIAAMEAGATGIAAINTIKSIMNVNLDTFTSGPDVRGRTSVGGYSGKAVKPIALRFIHSMKSHPALRDVPISGMGGIETWRDAAEFMALGCENIQVTTAVMQYGYRVINEMIEGLSLYLGSHGYKSVSEIVGRALENIVPAEALDRESICFPRFDKSRCLGCGRCTLSCYDGGHQALVQEPSSGMPILDATRCVGCHLCLSVCPVAAVTPGNRVPKEKLKNRAG